MEKQEKEKLIENLKEQLSVIQETKGMLKGASFTGIPEAQRLLRVMNFLNACEGYTHSQLTAVRKGEKIELPEVTPTELLAETEKQEEVN